MPDTSHNSGKRISVARPCYSRLNSDFIWQVPCGHATGGAPRHPFFVCTESVSGSDDPFDVQPLYGLVAATDRVKIIRDQQIGQEKGLGLGGLSILSLLNLDRTFMGLPIAGDPVDDLMGAFSAGASLV